MGGSRRHGVSRRDLFGSLLKGRKLPAEPDPREATLSVHSQDRVQDLLRRLQEKNSAPENTLPRKGPEENE